MCFGPEIVAFGMTSGQLLTAGATAFSAISQVSQANQARAMGDFQQRQAHADATAEREAALVRAGKLRDQGERAQSAARASMAGSGIDTGSGTPVRLEGEIVRNAEEEALNEILYGNRKGARLEQEGELAQLVGKNRQTSGYMGAAGSLLSGGASLARGWRAGAQQAPAPVEDRNPSGAIRIR